VSHTLIWSLQVVWSDLILGSTASTLNHPRLLRLPLELAVALLDLKLEFWALVLVLEHRKRKRSLTNRSACIFAVLYDTPRLDLPALLCTKYAYSNPNLLVHSSLHRVDDSAASQGQGLFCQRTILIS
jgi:hypothetical protein